MQANKQKVTTSDKRKRIFTTTYAPSNSLLSFFLPSRLELSKVNVVVCMSLVANMSGLVFFVLFICFSILTNDATYIARTGPN